MLETYFAEAASIRELASIAKDEGVQLQLLLIAELYEKLGRLVNKVTMNTLMGVTADGSKGAADILPKEPIPESLPKLRVDE